MRARRLLAAACSSCTDQQRCEAGETGVRKSDACAKHTVYTIYKAYTIYNHTHVYALAGRHSVYIIHIMVNYMVLVDHDKCQ